MGDFPIFGFCFRDLPIKVKNVSVSIFNRNKVIYDNSDESLNDIIPIKESIAEFFPTGLVV